MVLNDAKNSFVFSKVNYNDFFSKEIPKTHQFVLKLNSKNPKYNAQANVSEIKYYENNNSYYLLHDKIFNTLYKSKIVLSGSPDWDVQFISGSECIIAFEFSDSVFYLGSNNTKLDICKTPFKFKFKINSVKEKTLNLLKIENIYLRKIIKDIHKKDETISIDKLILDPAKDIVKKYITWKKDQRINVDCSITINYNNQKVFLDYDKGMLCFKQKREDCRSHLRICFIDLFIFLGVQTALEVYDSNNQFLTYGMFFLQSEDQLISNTVNKNNKFYLYKFKGNKKSVLVYNGDELVMCNDTSKESYVSIEWKILKKEDPMEKLCIQKEDAIIDKKRKIEELKIQQENLNNLELEHNLVLKSYREEESKKNDLSSRLGMWESAKQNNQAEDCKCALI